MRKTIECFTRFSFETISANINYFVLFYIMPVPKNIFTFWSGKKNEVVEWCIGNVRNMNPSWNIYVLNEKDLIPTKGIENLMVQHKSDWARVCALEKYGGVWLDATCVCTRGVEAWVDMQSDSLQGFTAPWDDNVFENWAFATPPNTRLMSEWKKEFERAINMGFNKYKNQLPAWVQWSSLYNQCPYLTQHMALHIVSNRTSDASKTTKSCDGPLKHLCLNNFVIVESFDMLNNEKFHAPPLIKFRGSMDWENMRMQLGKDSLFYKKYFDKKIIIYN